MTAPPAGPVVGAYRGMLPWLLIAWLIAAVLPGPAAQQVLLAAGVSPFLVAAAARGMALHPDRSVPALAVERAFSQLTSLLPLLLFAALAAAIGATLGAMGADVLGLDDARLIGLPLAALAALPILWWHWPAAVLAYMVPEEAGYRRPDGRAWRGPRYGDARRLVRAAGSPARTALIVGILVLWVAALTVVRGSTADAPWPLIVDATTWLVLLPLLVALGAVETRRMLAAAQRSSRGGA